MNLKAIVLLQLNIDYMLHTTYKVELGLVTLALNSVISDLGIAYSMTAITPIIVRIVVTYSIFSVVSLIFSATHT